MYWLYGFFLAAISFNTPKQKKIWKSISVEPAAKASLSISDNHPLFSLIFGKHQCKQNLHPGYH